MAVTKPWSIHGGGGIPFWETLPQKESEFVMEHYIERCAIMEFDGKFPRHLAEIYAYAFMFVDSPELVSPFVTDQQIEVQTLRVSVIRGRNAELDRNVAKMHAERWASDN